MLILLKSIHTVFWGFLRAFINLFPIIGFIHFGVFQGILAVIYSYVHEPMLHWYDDTFWPLIALFSAYLLFRIIFDFFSGSLVKKYTVNNAYNTDNQTVTETSHPCLYKMFNDLKQKFELRNVDLVISRTSSPAAFTASSLALSVVVVNDDILNELAKEQNNYGAVKALFARQLSRIHNGAGFIDTLYEIIIHHSRRLGDAGSTDLMSGRTGDTNYEYEEAAGFFSVIKLIMTIMVFISSTLYSLIAPIEAFFTRLLDKKMEYRCEAGSLNVVDQKEMEQYYMYMLRSGHAFNPKKNIEKAPVEEKMFRIINRPPVWDKPVENRRSQIAMVLIPLLSFSLGLAFLSLLSFEKTYSIFVINSRHSQGLIAPMFDSFTAFLFAPDSGIFRGIVHGISTMYAQTSRGFFGIQRALGVRLHDSLHNFILISAWCVLPVVILRKLIKLLGAIMRKSSLAARVKRIKTIQGKGETPYDILPFLGVKYRNIHLALCALENKSSPFSEQEFEDFTGSAVDYAEQACKKAILTDDKKQLADIVDLYKTSSQTGEI